MIKSLLYFLFSLLLGVSTQVRADTDLDFTQALSNDGSCQVSLGGDSELSAKAAVYMYEHSPMLCREFLTIYCDADGKRCVVFLTRSAADIPLDKFIDYSAKLAYSFAEYVPDTPMAYIAIVIMRDGSEPPLVALNVHYLKIMEQAKIEVLRWKGQEYKDTIFFKNKHRVWPTKPRKRE